MGDKQDNPPAFPAPRGVSDEIHAASLKVAELHRKVRETTNVLALERLELGRALLALKPLVPHGLWRDHLDTYGIHYHIASRAMRMVKPRNHSTIPNQQRPLRAAVRIPAIPHSNDKAGKPIPPTDPEMGTMGHISDAVRFQGQSLRQVEIALGVRSRPQPEDPDGLQPLTVEELEVYEQSLPKARVKRESRGQMHFVAMYEQAKSRVTDAIEQLCSGLPERMGARMRELKAKFLVAAEAILGGTP